MAIYTIADLHLSFAQSKPMDIFGENWVNHEEKIKSNWIKKVKPDDTVILPGDFSWAMYLEDAFLDFRYLNSLPGNKILLKGNHDYWWTTITNMKKYLKENEFETIDFLYNNSYCIENKIIVGTRGWNLLEDDDGKMLNRETIRLELSIKEGIKKYGEDKEMIAFMHYPPITQGYLRQKKHMEFVNVMKKYHVKRCYYGHLHGASYEEAVEGKIEGIELKLVSADYLDFNLITIETD
ncbi:MAG: serine/threonine protein phosphatase [Clostridia bacterium]|nr:serine/threonine protein phosphatase [Clostridia bacterium]